MNRPPDTGNADCDRFIRETFVREPYTNMHGEEAPMLLIKAGGRRCDMRLNYAQVQELVRYLRERFCGYCGGTQVDPEAWSGRCE